MFRLSLWSYIYLLPLISKGLFLCSISHQSLEEEAEEDEEPEQQQQQINFILPNKSIQIISPDSYVRNY